ncbi:hypothetical protein BVH35_006355 [Campylobacter fetus]|uniref:hypothetical protein n=1 Tax=Campylobacter fetus TaxID=196 RepID=UPI000818A44B|nr:hypothetical protein [Campylobacter fetus]MPB72806.1 hypothetical protein [Campylobacter fetus]MPB76889.1 hypothetical protein [Campylobacter fetus]OCR98391.1 hypothetical protein CFT12S02855_02355 [Campylobacter fetus subsp. testudinum]
MIILVIIWLIAILFAIPSYGISILIAGFITYIRFNTYNNDMQVTQDWLFEQYKRYFITMQNAKNHRPKMHPRDEYTKKELRELLSYTYAIVKEHYGANSFDDSAMRTVIKVTFDTVYTYCNIFGVSGWKTYDIDDYVKDPTILLDLATRDYNDDLYNEIISKYKG